MKEELEASAALVHSYVPPAPEKLQAVIAAGKVTISPGAGAAAAGHAFSLRVHPYVQTSPRRCSLSGFHDDERVSRLVRQEPAVMARLWARLNTVRQRK